MLNEFLHNYKNLKVGGQECSVSNSQDTTRHQSIACRNGRKLQNRLAKHIFLWIGSGEGTWLNLEMDSLSFSPTIVY